MKSFDFQPSKLKRLLGCVSKTWCLYLSLPPKMNIRFFSWIAQDPAELKSRPGIDNSTDCSTEFPWTSNDHFVVLNNSPFKIAKNFKKIWSSKFWVVNFRDLSWSENQQIDPFKAKSTVARIFVPTCAIETAFSGYFQSEITKNWDC